MAEKQIVIRRKSSKETRIQNRIIWDNSISIAARFALIAMLSLPDDWDYSVRGMAVMLKTSNDTMCKYMRELERAGYLMRRQTSDGSGRFCKAQYIITDTPGDFGETKPCPKNSDTDEVRPDLPGQVLPESENEPCPKNSDTEEPCPNLPGTEKPCPNLPDAILPDAKNQSQKKRTEEKKRTEQKNPPKSPQGGRRRSRFDLDEEAKPILRAYVGEDRELAQALGEHIKLRSTLRAVNSAYAIRILLAKLDELSGGRREDKLRLIRQAIAGSWKSYFPLNKGTSVASAPSAPGLVASEAIPTW